MVAFIPQELYGIIGFPLGHSMSPLLHNTAFQTIGHPGVMLPWSIEPGRVRDFAAAMKLLNIRGSCVAIPHKTEIIPCLDKQSERVKLIGACNTLYWEGDKLCGENTDVLGFLTPLERQQLSKSAKTLILGAGGAGRAVVAGLKTLGIKDITIVDVVDNLPDTLALEFDLKRAPWDERLNIEAELIVNVTPLGMAGKFFEQSAYPLEAFRAHKPGLAYDVVYNPAETRFIREARQAGWKTIAGQTMFFAQANHQFKLWTGRDLPEEALDAIRNHLAKAL